MYSCDLGYLFTQLSSISGVDEEVLHANVTICAVIPVVMTFLTVVTTIACLGYNV